VWLNIKSIRAKWRKIMVTKNTEPWFMWPFMAIWNLLAFVLNITGRVLAGILWVGLMIVGIALTMTVAGAPVGIPFAILGFLLIIRSIL
jgi:hypothetical protein